MTHARRPALPFFFIALLTFAADIACRRAPATSPPPPADGETVAQAVGHAMVQARREVLVKTAAGELSRYPLQADGDTLRGALGRFGHYREVLTRLDSATVRGEVSIAVTTDEAFLVQCPLVLPKVPARAGGDQRPPYFMIPGFLYGSNNLVGSDGVQPKFDYGGAVGWPNSSKFYVRADRSSHPSVITVRGGRVGMVGIAERVSGVTLDTATRWSPGYLYNGLMLDSSDPGADVVGFQIGYENAPLRYSWARFGEPDNDAYLAGYIAGRGGQNLRTTTLYYDAPAAGVPDGGKALRAYYAQFHEGPRARSTRAEALAKISAAIVEDSWQPGAKAFGLVDGERSGGGAVGDIAWTGGVQVAYPLLKAARKIGYAEGERVATAFLDNLCSGAVLNARASLLNEEFRDGAWQVTGWWGTREDCLDFGDAPLHSAYANGQAAYYLLKAYELTGRRYGTWLATAQTVLATALRSQTPAGAYANFFDPNTGGARVVPSVAGGFQSCWFVPGMALLSQITSDAAYLASAERAADYYHGFHERGELFGTPMDTHNAVDQEGNLAFLAACTELHRATGSEKYLRYGRAGLDWEFSWKFAYNTAHTNETLRTMAWSSSGGSITSTHNPSIHQMGNLAAADIYYLYQQTSDPYLASRLTDVCTWGLGAYNTHDGDFGYGRAGQATEQFFYTDALVLPWPGPWDGGVWAASLPWASACVLLSCAEDIPDVYFGE